MTPLASFSNHPPRPPTILFGVATLERAQPSTSACQSLSVCTKNGRVCQDRVPVWPITAGLVIGDGAVNESPEPQIFGARRNCLREQTLDLLAKRQLRDTHAQKQTDEPTSKQESKQTSHNKTTLQPNSDLMGTAEKLDDRCEMTLRLDATNVATKDLPIR